MGLRRSLVVVAAGAAVLAGPASAGAQSPLVTSPPTTAQVSPTTVERGPVVPPPSNATIPSNQNQVLPVAEVRPAAEVTATPAERPATQVRGNVLARTGAALTEPTVVGAALAAAGAVLVLTARRRRTAPALL